MRSKLLVGAVLLVAGSWATAQEAPFCAVTAMGANCHFYSASACYQAIQGLDGKCVANPSAMQPQVQPAPALSAPYPVSLPPLRGPDVTGGFIAGQQAGAAARADEIEIRHIEAASRAARPAEPVSYICMTDPSKWETVESSTPGPNCIPKPQ